MEANSWLNSYKLHVLSWAQMTRRNPDVQGLWRAVKPRRMENEIPDAFLLYRRILLGAANDATFFFSRFLATADASLSMFIIVHKINTDP